MVLLMYPYYHDDKMILIIKPAIHLSSNWGERKKMLMKWEKRELYRWHFVNRLANHFSHLEFRHSRQAIGIFTKHQRGCTASFLSSFSWNQRWTKSVILREVYSDWFAISRNSSQNSAWTCRNTRNDKCIASFSLLATGHKVADLWWQNIELPRRWLIKNVSFKVHEESWREL